MLLFYYYVSIICFCLWILLSIADYFILKKNGKLVALKDHLIESYLIVGITLAIFWPLILVSIIISSIRGDYKKSFLQQQRENIENQRRERAAIYQCPCCTRL